ncbi:OadG family protein [Vreelandella sp. EE22]
MQESKLLQEGLALMGLGMGFVFVFLTILVVSVTLMSALVTRLQPAREAVSERARAAAPAARQGNDEDVMVVISAAVHRYRASRKR